jgi:hypothetical protein
MGFQFNWGVHKAMDKKHGPAQGRPKVGAARRAGQGKRRRSRRDKWAGKGEA